MLCHIIIPSIDWILCKNNSCYWGWQQFASLHDCEYICVEKLQICFQESFRTINKGSCILIGSLQANQISSTNKKDLADIKFEIAPKFVLRFKWLEQNKLQGSPLPRRFPESNLLPRRSPERAHQSPLESRNPTASNPEQLPSGKSENTKSQLTSSSENFPSKDSSEKLLMSSSKNSGSRARLFWPCKSLLKLT